MNATTSRRWARAAALVAVSLLIIKSIAAWITGSHAVFSDAAESVVNVVASGVMLLAVETASKPADTEHPFGHGKAELLAAAFEGALLLVAAGAIAWEGVPGLFNPRPIEHLGLGSVLIGVTALGNAAFGWMLIRTGRRTSSPALVADGRHLLTDSVSTVVVVGAMGVVLLTEIRWIDPAAACAVAVWIAYTGVKLMAGAARGLMDTHTPEYVEQIAAALQTQRIEGLLDPHDLRIIDATSNVVVLLHARAPWMWTLSQARSVHEQATERITALFDVPAEVHVQLEPCVPANCPTCPLETCSRRIAPYQGTPEWDPAKISAPHP